MLFISLFYAQKIDLVEIRRLFTIAEAKEEACEQLLKMSDGYTIDYKPVVFGYHAAATMTMANHVIWPGTKLSYFNEGKSNLELVINKYPNDVELRYIRFAVQYGSPNFLNYNENLKSDRQFIKSHLDNQDYPSSFKELVTATIEQPLK